MPPILPPPEFEALVHAHHAEVYRSARRIVASDADALDVTQQVFLRVLEGKAALGDARDVGRVLRWLAARTALAHLRGSRLRAEKEEQHAMEQQVQRPDDEATRAEARLELTRRLARLPDELRTALVLRFQENWTFAQIASEQACSEPSAHDRVRRGLERLRAELSRAGFAGIAAGLPRELAVDPGSSALPIPAGLEHRLLGLRATATIASSSQLAAGAFALISIVAVAAAAVWRPSFAGRERELVSVETPSSVPAEQLPAPASSNERSATPPASVLKRDLETALAVNSNRASTEQDETGTLSGRCIDEQGLPVSLVDVFATSLQRDSKFARYSVSSATGTDGRFQLQAPVSIEGGEEYVLTTRHPDFVAHTRDHARARAGETTELGDFQLLRSSRDAAGDSLLEVLVLDAAGAPVQNAIVTVQRPVLAADGRLNYLSEAHASTQSDGRVALNLTRLGTKRLVVLPPPGELGPSNTTLGIDAPGRYERTLVLERGPTIRGTLVGIGGTLVHGQGGFLAAFADTDSPWIQAEIDDRSGSFVLRGLENDRRYTLVHDGDEWSRVQIENVLAGTSGLSIQLKLESDVRDIGDHQAELHGEVRDAKTGAVLALEAFTIEPIRIDEFKGQDWQRDILPALIFPRPVQTGMFGEYVPLRSFHVEGLEPGTYAVAARLAGFAPAFAGPFELKRSEMRTGIVINVEAPAVLRGVLTDPDDRPLPNAFARVSGLGEASSARDRAADESLRATRGQGILDVWDVVRTDDEGRFEFPGLPAWSSLRLVVHHPDFELATSAPLELHSGGVTDIGRISLGARRAR